MSSKEEDAAPSCSHLRSIDTAETVVVQRSKDSWPEADSGPFSAGRQ